MLSVDLSNILAICVIVVIAGGMASLIIYAFYRSPFTIVQSLLYAINYLVTRILWRTKVNGVLAIPPGKGAIIACNHRCPLDPAFIAITTTRVVHWLVAREYCEHPILGPFLMTCGSIPVSRGEVDMSAMKTAIGLLQKGELVGIFPEGKINVTDDLLLPGRRGAALMALKARVPVVPCYIEGAPYDGTTLGCLLMPASVRLTIGKPIDIEPFLNINENNNPQDELTLKILGEIAKLAGRDDFQPALAHSKRKNNLSFRLE